MDMLTYLFFLSSGLFLGWSLGANDASNIFGTAVGSKMLKFNTAAIVASVFVVLGAVFGGQGAAATLDELGSVNALAGSFMVALAAALTVYWMLRIGVTVSISQAIVGSIIGWNLYCGLDTDLTALGKILSGWILCPLLAAVLAVFLYYILRKNIRKAHLHLLRQDSYMRISLIIAGALGAYALGANNIANVMGVFAESSPFKPVALGSFLQLSGEQVLFLMGAIAICVGIFTYSKKSDDDCGQQLDENDSADGFDGGFGQCRRFCLYFHHKDCNIFCTVTDCRRFLWCRFQVRRRLSAVFWASDS